MVRYADVVVSDMQRMRVARESRGFEGRHLGHLRVIAQSAGALFIRSYERGERVHLAMLSRGYAGAMPLADHAPMARRAWASVAALPLAAAGVAVASGWFA
jgi:cobalt/nickel transport system permease protein